MGEPYPITERGITQAIITELKKSIARFKRIRKDNIFRNEECRIRCTSTIDNLIARLHEEQGNLTNNRK